MVRARRRRDGDTGAVLDALIITSGLGVLVVDLSDPAVRARGRHDDVLQVDLDRVSAGRHLALCVCSSAWCSAAGPENTSVRLLAVGRARACLVADCVYGWIQLHGSWKVGGPTDLGWVLFYVCWGAAALHPAMRELTVEQPWRPRHLKPVTLALLSASALVAPLVTRMARRRGRPEGRRHPRRRLGGGLRAGDAPPDRPGAGPGDQRSP